LENAPFIVLFSTFAGNAENQNNRGKYLVKMAVVRAKVPNYLPCTLFSWNTVKTMRIRSLFPFLALLFACQSRPAEQTGNKAPTAIATPDTLCYRQILSRDTTTLRLVIDGDQATGYLDNNPYEKDRAQRPFRGTMRGLEIQADWQRSGEGITQPYLLDLTINSDSISWYEGKRVEQQGKWKLKDPATDYQYTLTKIGCPAISLQ
jgi:hypothetical protein